MALDRLASSWTARRVVSSSQSSRTIWQDFEVAAAIRAKGKNQKAKGKNPDPELLPFAFWFLPFALTAARRLCVQALLRLWFRLRRARKRQGLRPCPPSTPRPRRGDSECPAGTVPNTLFPRSDA